MDAPAHPSSPSTTPKVFVVATAPRSVRRGQFSASSAPPRDMQFGPGAQSPPREMQFGRGA